MKSKKFIHVFFDTEYTNNGMIYELISMGFVTENDEKYYCELEVRDKSKISDWIKKNVISQLKNNPENVQSAKTKLIKWFNKISKNKKIRLISWGQFDLILLYSLWVTKKGKLNCWRYTIPKKIYHANHIEMSTLFTVNNIKSNINRIKFSGISKKIKRHNSLSDALILKSCYKKLTIKLPN